MIMPAKRKFQPTTAPDEPLEARILAAEQARRGMVFVGLRYDAWVWPCLPPADADL